MVKLVSLAGTVFVSENSALFRICRQSRPLVVHAVECRALGFHGNSSLQRE